MNTRLKKFVTEWSVPILVMLLLIAGLIAVERHQDWFVHHQNQDLTRPD